VGAIGALVGMRVGTEVFSTVGFLVGIGTVGFNVGFLVTGFPVNDGLAVGTIKGIDEGSDVG